MATRREFLTARPLRDALQRAADAAGECVPLAGNTLRLGTTAMACDFEAILNPPAGGLLSAASDALELIARLEDQMSVYRLHSELCRLNARAASEPVVVERQLFELLRLCVAYAGETEGAFDPTAGPLVALWRQCRRERRLPTQSELSAALSRVGCDDVEFNDRTNEVHYRRPALEMNLNAIGKGYALDRAGAVMEAGARDEGRGAREGGEGPGTRGQGPGNEGAVSQQASPESYLAPRPSPLAPASSPGPWSLAPGPSASWLLHGGHSSILARGSLFGADGWPIAIRHPLIPNRPWGVLWLKDRGMSTSGSAVQFFRVEGRRYGHLLDPRTGRPAEGILSVTVLAPSAARAEALSTAFFVLGVEKARSYCHNHREVSALIVPEVRQGQRLEPIVCGIPDSDLIWADDESPGAASSGAADTTPPA